MLLNWKGLDKDLEDIQQAMIPSARYSQTEGKGKAIVFILKLANNMVFGT